MNQQYSTNDMAAVAREEAAARQVASGSVFAGATLGQAPERALPATRDRIAQLIERTGEVASRLEAIGDKVFGQLPQPDEKSGISTAAVGDISAIHDALDRLSAQLARTHDAMTRLESL